MSFTKTPDLPSPFTRTLILSKKSITPGRSKHIDVRYHFCREKVESGDIEVQYCATEIMLAYVLTKPLVSVRHSKLCNAIMGLPT
jgi:hypothetical protein